MFPREGNVFRWKNNKKFMMHLFDIVKIEKKIPSAQPIAVRITKV